MLLKMFFSDVLYIIIKWNIPFSRHLKVESKNTETHHNILKTVTHVNVGRLNYEVRKESFKQTALGL